MNSDIDNFPVGYQMEDNHQPNQQLIDESVNLQNISGDENHGQSRYPELYDNMKSQICGSPVNAEDDDSYHLNEASSSSASTNLPTGKDSYCWNCHKDRINIHCKVCPRSYHFRCISTKTISNNKSDSWVCSECQDIMNAEETSSRSPTLSRLTVDELCQLLKFALSTIKSSADPSFHKPVSSSIFPDYHQLICHPMDVSTIEKNIRTKMYGCTQSFLADIKWIVHNCTIYNNSSHPLTTNAKYLARVARNEMAEMEICPDCFKNFYTVQESWFAEPCRKPHALVYARVKGYPIWPAKAVRLGGNNEVDCRFFGTHDRSWVSIDLCWFISEEHPGTRPTKAHKTKFEGAMKELQLHIQRLDEKFPARFKYAALKTPFDPLKMFILDEPNQTQPAASLVSSQESERNNSPKRKVQVPVFNFSPEKDEEVKSTSTNDSNVDKKPEVISPVSMRNESNNIFINEDPNGKGFARTARVGKRKVAEALLSANKVMRTPTSVQSSFTFQSPSNNSSNSSTPNLSSMKSKVINSPESQEEEIEALRKQLTYDSAMHQEEIKKIKQYADRMLRERRQSWTSEKEKAVADERRKAELEKKILIAQYEADKKRLTNQIEEVKKKQWCAQCLKEARLFCCYDTWYCDYPCQKEHWRLHVNVCQQIQKKHQTE